MISRPTPSALTAGVARLVGALLLAVLPAYAQVAGVQVATWSLREAKSIGDSVAAVPLSNALGIIPTPDGRIWVSFRQGRPPAPTSILILDDSGRSVRQIKGFTNIDRMEVVDSGVLVTDLADQRTNVFDLRGERLRTAVMSRESRAVRSVSLRYGHVLRITQPIADGSLRDSVAVLYQVVTLHAPGSPRIDTIARIRLDRAWNEILRLWQQPRFGKSGAVAWAGDSLIVVLDGNAGTVRWYAIGESALKMLRSESFGAPRAVTSDDLRVAETVVARSATRVGGNTQARVKFTNYASQWSLADNIVVAADGKVLIKAYSPEVYPQRWLVFPADSGAAAELVLPDRFWLDAADGRRLYGRFAAPGRALARVYEIDSK